MAEAIRDDGDSGEPGRPDNISQITSKARERIEPEFEKARAQIQAGTDKALQQADVGLGMAAEGLESASGHVRSFSSEYEGTPARAGAAMADEMHDTASYLKDHSSGEIIRDIQAHVRKHPIRAVLTAVVIGFLVGRTLH
jgi:ElaB/YqjD/DUF883 family membrane-anchored ribosome-binding protein